MRLSLTMAASFGLAVAGQPLAGADERDFVFTDNEGHMVLRFAGAGARGLEPEQMEEIINVSLSTMVHDRLRADGVFEAEPIDPHWADPMAARLRTHVHDTGPEFSAIDVECRSSTCRLVLEHADRLNVNEHQALMGVVQLVIRSFIDAHSARFDPVFLLSAYEQEAEPPNVKVFLWRADLGD